MVAAERSLFAWRRRAQPIARSDPTSTAIERRTLEMPPNRRIARRTARRTSRRTANRMENRQQAAAAAAAEPQAAPAPQPAAATAPAAPAQTDRYEELKRLAELHEQGILTDEEFAAEKAKILGSN
jgi:hypothetical protein